MTSSADNDGSLKLVKDWLGVVGARLQQCGAVPTIYELWSAAQALIAAGNVQQAEQCEMLIRVLHNSFVSIRMKLGANVDFAYGGIGTVIHKDVHIGDDCMIGQGVTIGGAPGVARFDAALNARVSYPKIHDSVYIAAGARIIGGVDVGSFSIIGADAVLKTSVPPFSICAGVPVRTVRPITPDQFLRYKSMWSRTKFMANDDYLAFIRDQYDKLVTSTSTSTSTPAQAPPPREPAGPAPAADTGSVARFERILQDPDAVRGIVAHAFDDIADDFSPLKTCIDRGASVEIGLPFTDTRIHVDPEAGVDYTIGFDVEPTTNALFFLSLQWIGQLLVAVQSSGNERLYRVAEAALRSYFAHVDDDDRRRRVYGLASSDHAIAIRIRVLVRFLRQSRARAALSLQIDCLRELHRMSDWLCDPTNYRANNHGLMGALALLHSAILFADYPEFAARYAQVGTERIIGLVGDAFDEDGLCNENTIGYHRFNMSLYAAAMAFAKRHRISENIVRIIEPVLVKANLALRHCIWQNGNIPPIGDSPQYETSYASINRNFFSRHSGFAVIKNDDLYLSLICGARGHTHKQMDNSSITLRYKGKNILIDAGHYSHNATDPLRRALATQRGHSGVFLDAYDDQLFYDITNRGGGIEAGITEFTETDAYVALRCRYAIADADHDVEREVRVIWPDEVLIKDTVRRKDGAAAGPPVAAVQRFILPPELTVAPHDGRSMVLADDGGVRACLHHFSASQTSSYRAEMAPLSRGWYSVQFGEVLPTTGIDLRQVAAAPEFITVIKLSGACAARDLMALAHIGTRG